MMASLVQEIYQSRRLLNPTFLTCSIMSNYPTKCLTNNHSVVSLLFRAFLDTISVSGHFINLKISTIKFGFASQITRKLSIFAACHTPNAFLDCRDTFLTRQVFNIAIQKIGRRSPRVISDREYSISFLENIELVPHAPKNRAHRIHLNVITAYLSPAIFKRRRRRF